MVDKVGSYTVGNLLISLVAGLASFRCLRHTRGPVLVPLAFGGRGVRPDPDDRRDAGRGDLRTGRAPHHRALADHG